MKSKKLQEKTKIVNEKEPYFQEWLESKVDPEIIELNVQYLDKEYALEAILGNALEKMGEGQKVPHSQQYATTNVASLINKYQHLSDGGWYCAGVNVNNHYIDSEWGCFKPKNPRYVQGKIVKYEHPPKVNTEIFALRVSDAIWQKNAQHWESPKGDEIEFWAWVKNRTNVPLFITEGAKKAGALLSAGFPAIALPGINTGTRQDLDDKGKVVDYLIPQLAHFAKSGKEIIFVFDQDKKFKTKKAVAWAIIKMGKAFQPYGCNISVLDWNPDDGKGIDDFIANKGAAALSKLYSSRIDLETYKQNKIRSVRKFDNEPDFQDFLREYEIPTRLKYNELTLEIELDGEIFDDPDYFKSWFQDNYSCSVSDKIFYCAIFYFAKNNGYHPVKDYLNSLTEVTPISLDDLSSRYFGTRTDLDNEKLKRWLVGSVARMLTPKGADFAAALILYGREQGMGKSRFFKTLGGDWHCDDIEELKGRDNALKQHRYWILEVAEFDQVTNKNEANFLKNWIGRVKDSFREPFGRKVKEYMRKFAIAGTVNEVELIKDETGSRRFWIIDTNDRPIDFDKLATERDGIWAAAVQAYHAGYKYWFDRPELRALQDANAKFEAFDDWQGIIEGYLADTQICSTADIVTDCFKIELNAPEYRKQQIRVTKILTKLRYSKFKQLDSVDKQGKDIRAMYWISESLRKAIEAGQISENSRKLSDFQSFEIEEETENETENENSAIPESKKEEKYSANYSGTPNPVTQQALEFEKKNESQGIANYSRTENPDPERLSGITNIPESKSDEKKISENISPEKKDRIDLLALLKIEQQRLEWSEEDLKKSLKRTFPRKQGTQNLSNAELKQFWDYLRTLKPISELKRLQEERERGTNGS